MMGLARLQRFGHTPIAIVGGGTGHDRRSERQVAGTPAALARADRANVAGIRDQLERFLDFDARRNAARIVNNAEWLAPSTSCRSCATSGKHFTVNYMLQKESVSRRLESEEGISYTEFSYLLLQAYDFVQLFDRYGCTLQMGGSDQWGNITAGIDLDPEAPRDEGARPRLAADEDGVGREVRQDRKREPCGSTRRSPRRFDFYQFWLNTDDRDVVRYLKCFTFLRARDRVARASTSEAPERREAQRALAREVTALVHGADQVGARRAGAAVLFGEHVDDADVDDVLMVFDDAPSTESDAAGGRHVAASRCSRP